MPYEHKDPEYPTGLDEADAADRVHLVKTANDEFRLAVVEHADGKQRTELVGKDKETFIHHIEIMTNGASQVIKKPLTAAKFKFVKFF